MDTKLYTLGGSPVSLQVGNMGNIPEGDFKPGITFLIKNITEDNITVQILPANASEYIETVLYPGWNPELVKGVKQVSANQLQYGY